MKKTLLNTALGHMCGALALTLMVGAGPALADDNTASADDQIAIQNSLNGNGSGNELNSGNDNDNLDLDVTDAGNESFNDNGSDNTLGSNNDNDGLDLDVAAEDTLNDKSADDNDLIDADVELEDAFNNKSTNTADVSLEKKEDASVTIGDMTSIVSEQHLLGLAAAVNMSTESGDITTGSVEYGTGANTMAAGNMTESANTGAGSIAQATSGIQAKGNFRIGN